MPKKEIEVVLDVETTGLDYTKEKIIEFAGVKLINGKIKDKFETLINAKQHIRKSSQAIHGISEEDLIDAPTEEEIYPKIFEFLEGATIVAHNAIFDFSFLNRASKRLYDKPLENNYIDTQMMFKEVYPQYESCGLDSLCEVFKGNNEKRHRAMGDALALAQCYPKLKKLYFEKYAWQLAQIDNVGYLFERYLRLQNTINIMQGEIQDLRSIFRIYFERGGKDIEANTGEILTYNHKKNFFYDFEQIKPTLDEIGVLSKAVKLNNAFVDRLSQSGSISDETREIIKNARKEIAETRTFSIVKPDKKA